MPPSFDSAFAAAAVFLENGTATIRLRDANGVAIEFDAPAFIGQGADDAGEVGAAASADRWAVRVRLSEVPQAAKSVPLKLWANARVISSGAPFVPDAMFIQSATALPGLLHLTCSASERGVGGRRAP